MGGNSGWVYLIPCDPTKGGELKIVVSSQPAPLSRGAARPRSCPPKKVLASMRACGCRSLPTRENQARVALEATNRAPSRQCRGFRTTGQVSF